MKAVIGLDTGTYTFNPATRQITLSNVISGGVQDYAIDLEQLILIVNVTDNIMLYNFCEPTLGGSISSNVITVNYNTTAMSSTDRLMIIIDVVDSLEDLLRLINRFVKQSESLSNVDNQQRIRVAVDTFGAALSLSTLTTLTTVTNPVPVGNVATIGGLDPRYNYIDTARIAYNVGIRNQLTFS